MIKYGNWIICSIKWYIIQYGKYCKIIIRSNGTIKYRSYKSVKWSLEIYNAQVYYLMIIRHIANIVKWSLDPMGLWEFPTAKYSKMNITLWKSNIANYQDIPVGGFNPSEKNDSQLGWIFPIYGNIKTIFRTTNQYNKIIITLW